MFGYICEDDDDEMHIIYVIVWYTQCCILYVNIYTILRSSVNSSIDTYCGFYGCVSDTEMIFCNIKHITQLLK